MFHNSQLLKAKGPKVNTKKTNLPKHSLVLLVVHFHNPFSGAQRYINKILKGHYKNVQPVEPIKECLGKLVFIVLTYGLSPFSNVQFWFSGNQT